MRGDWAWSDPADDYAEYEAHEERPIAPLWTLWTVCGALVAFLLIWYLPP